MAITTEISTEARTAIAGSLFAKPPRGAPLSDMSQICHPADAPQIRTSRSFLTERAPAPRISRCGRSWINKPTRTGASPRSQPEGPDKARANSQHGGTFLSMGGG